MINDRMPEYCVSRMSAILNRAKKPLNGSKILILGVAYKQDVADYRESPALRVIDLLRSQQADVSFYDPYIQEYAYKGASYKGEPELSAGLLRRSDLVVITTMHQVVDYGFVARNAKLIFDTKNAMKNIMDRHNIEVL
jgi:UDP-N-acetyl-D-glucosamine dehydrogenase